MFATGEEFLPFRLLVIYLVQFYLGGNDSILVRTHNVFASFLLIENTR